MDIENQLAFASRTVLGKDETNKLQQLIQYLFNTSDSEPFQMPVDWQALNLVDYPVIIKTPMDLGTVRKKVTLGQYQYVEDALEDIHLIWQNAKVYNPKQHAIHKLADKLEKLTKKIIRNYLPFVKLDSNQGKKKQSKKESKATKQNNKMQLAQPKNYMEKQEEARNENEAQENAEQPPHIIDKKNFLYFVHLCNGQQIGVVFLLIKSNCPEAIEYDEDGNVNIRGEKIDDGLIKRLNNLLEMWGIGPKTVTFKKR